MQITSINLGYFKNTREIVSLVDLTRNPVQVFSIRILLFHNPANKKHVFIKGIIQMKSILLSSILASFITSGSEPQTKPTYMPDKCPGSSALSSEAINHVAPFPWGFQNPNVVMWTGVTENTSYDTNDTWSTLIFVDKTGTNAREVLQLMTSAMDSLVPMGEEPSWEVYLGVWACVYQNKEKNVLAITVTPSLYSETKIHSSV